MKKFIQKLIAILPVFFLFVGGVFAQVSVPLPGDRPDIEVDTFAPSAITNLADFGVYRFLGFVAMIIFGALWVFVIAQVILNAVKMMGAEDSDEGIKEGMSFYQNIIMGHLRPIGFLLVASILPSAIGIGSIFDWPQKLAQCGNGDFLFKAEYRATLANPELLGKETLIYCCEEMKFLGEKETEGPYVNNPYPDYATEYYVGAGTNVDGGWLFIGDPDGDKKYIDPRNVVEVNKCEVFYGRADLVRY